MTPADVAASVVALGFVLGQVYFGGSDAEQQLFL